MNIMTWIFWAWKVLWLDGYMMENLVAVAQAFFFLRAIDYQLWPSDDVLTTEVTSAQAVAEPHTTPRSPSTRDRMPNPLQSP